MEDIIRLGKQYSADRVWLNKMEDWNVFDNFNHMNIFSPEHPLHNDYQDRLEQVKSYLGSEKNPIVKAPTLNIQSIFDYRFCIFYFVTLLCKHCIAVQYSLQELRPISTPQLHSLLNFHLVPINLIISQGT